jgi:hypothetical protein
MIIHSDWENKIQTTQATTQEINVQNWFQKASPPEDVFVL